MRAAQPIGNRTGRHTSSPGRFSQLANATSAWTGKPVAFMLALGTVIVWAVTGPLFGFSDTWQLVINTGTTIVTFLMVFLIQNTQNRDTTALQIKLAELIVALEKADNKFAMIEEASDEELAAARRQLEKQANGGTTRNKARRHDRRSGQE